MVALAAPLAVAHDKPKPVGLWMGVMKAGPIDLRLAFQIDQGKDDKLTAKLISLDQNRAEVPVKTITLADGKLTLDLPAAGATYTGTLNEKGNGFTGEFKQLGNPFVLNLDRIEKLPDINRPQTPKAPFPYPSEEIAFENAAAKIKLAGTLTLSKGDGPFPAVVLVSGSGPQDRDETLFDYKPFLVIPDHWRSTASPAYGTMTAGLANRRACSQERRAPTSLPTPTPQ